MSANQFKTISLASEVKQPKSFDNDDPISMQEALKLVLTKKEIKRDFNETKIGAKTPALGSKDIVTYPGHDTGFLSTVLEAYNHHYNLRTGPEDWWYTIIQTVAIAIDKNATETDFSSSTKVHKIVGKIVLMKSVQEYFEYSRIRTKNFVYLVRWRGQLMSALAGHCLPY